MSELDGLIALIPIGDIAKKLGIDEDIARAAIAVAVPVIVAGLAANAKGGGAKSLEKAVGGHAGKSTKLDDIDEADGEKIVNNVFGTQKSEVVKAAATKAKAKAEGVDMGAIVAKILPIIAPIVLAFLASQLTKKPAAEEDAAPAATGTDIGALLGGLLASPEATSMIGGLLGGLLGGGKK